MEHRRWLGLIPLVAVIGVAACGSTATSPTDLARSVIRWSATGDYGRVYDNLYPAQQRVITRAKYVECSRSVQAVVKRLGVDLTTIHATANASSTRQRTSVPGTHTTTEATVVRVRVSVMIRGKRRTLQPSVSVDVTSVDGHWRYIDGLGTPIVPHCVGPPSETLGSELLAKVPAWAKQQGFANNKTAIAGAKLFAVSGCLNCHKYLGTGGGFRGAPDLTTEGSKTKGIAYQVAHLNCPSCVNPGSPMPSFAGLGARNLDQLAAFLEASKG